MVRLKVKHNKYWNEVTDYFNSTMVRLKDSMYIGMNNINANFNSTMVRLKAEYIGYKNKRFSNDFKSFFIKNYQRKVVCL